MPNTPEQDRIVERARVQNLVKRIETVIHHLSKLHVLAIELNRTPDAIEDAIVSLEQFIDQEITPM